MLAKDAVKSGSSIMSKVMETDVKETAKDDSLEAYLIEALYLIELRFQSLDEEGSGWVVYLIFAMRSRVEWKTG